MFARSGTVIVMIKDQFRAITLQQLESLVALIEERTFSRAAKKLLLTQPSLSKHIRNLEIFADCTLVERSKTGISLTEEGTQLYGYAKKILRLRDEAREKVLLTKEKVSGHVFVGASTIPATYILPSLLSSLRSTNPDISLHITPGDSEDVIEMVQSSQVELGFIGKHTQDRRLKVERLWDDELLLVAPKGHPWEKTASPLSLDELEQEPFIIREKGSATRQILENHLKEHFESSLSRFHVICEVGSSEAVKEAVIAGLGVSILSIHALYRELRHKTISRIPFVGPPITRSFSLIYRRLFTEHPHHRTFIEHARTHVPPCWFHQASPGA